MHSEMWLCVSVFSGLADKEFLELAFCGGYWWLASPLLQMTFTTFCVHGVCVFMSVPHRETSLARVNYKARIAVCVCVCVCDSPLSFSVCPPQRGVVLMTLPRPRSSWTSVGWDSVPCWQKGWHGWLTRQRYTHIHVHPASVRYFELQTKTVSCCNSPAKYLHKYYSKHKFEVHVLHTFTLNIV